MVAKNESNELHLTRLYDAPVDMVWAAWTDPAQVGQWWGPRGFTLTTHSRDLRPGGIWHYTMHGPDGTDYPNKTYYHEVEIPRKLVYDHGAYDDRPPLFRVTVLFTPQGSRTRMDMTMTLKTAEEAERIRRHIQEAGGHATWDRLAEHLGKLLSRREQFVIQRSFDAPLDQMFELWTNPQHLCRWLPPTGFTMRFLKADIRTGGSTLFLMTDHSGIEFYGRAEYRSVGQPGTIIYTQQFCDKQENLSRHPLAPVWPATLLTTVELTEEEDGRTRVKVTSEPIGEITPEELQAFLDSRAGMTLGWTGSFDKLEELLPGE